MSNDLLLELLKASSNLKHGGIISFKAISNYELEVRITWDVKGQIHGHSTVLNYRQIKDSSVSLFDFLIESSNLSIEKSLTK